MTDAAQEPVKTLEHPPIATPDKNGKKRSNAMKWLALFFIVAAVFWFFLWLFYLRFYQSTDDSYVNGNLINVNSVISGTPIAYFADDTDLVMQGQLLVLLDTTDYQIAYVLQKSNLASTVLQVRQLFEKVKEAKTNVSSKKALLEKALFDYQNRQKLIGSKAVSNEDFIHSKDDWRVAELEYQLAQDQLKTAEAAAGNGPIETHPLIGLAIANLRQAYYNLEHCAIYAPSTGYIAQRDVEVGQWVTPTIPMMAIIPIDYMWIDANFKETQLRNMRIGQPATVTIDYYGSGVVYEGKVLGIASGTGSVFSLIPPQNATGNWIKIVQRLPVRISLDPEKLKKHPLRLGLSANVDVDISKTDHFPMLAQVPPKKPVATTDVYNLNYDELNEEIKKIIKENLDQPLVENSPFGLGQKLSGLNDRKSPNSKQYGLTFDRSTAGGWRSPNGKFQLEAGIIP